MAWIYDDTRGQDRIAWGYYDDRAKNNANEFFAFFDNLGASKEAIAGMLGNISYESRINPGQEQVRGTGLGLIQWTPPTDLTEFVDYPWWDGNHQCQLIDDEGTGVTGGRWRPTRVYPYGWSEFLTLNNVHEATKAYFYERERGASFNNIRLDLADYWYNYIGGKKKRKMPLYMMMLRTKK